MDTQKPRRRWTRTATIVAVAVLACALTWYSRKETRLCSACGAWTERSERGLALGLDLRLPLYAVSGTTPMPNVLRFLPPDHVHDRDRSVRFSQDGPGLPFSAVVGCRGALPGDFARRLAGTPGFADFVASQIEAGKVDAATVRALVAVRARRADYAEDPAVVRRGEELFAESERSSPGDRR